ncbi:hypothetical protein DPEC_G00227780 [Dallia pectoralis]|uniref:Uncharacterized protein n=1 Tax=Dallia pectoralis TaxID=75939 RepID=A0ACC2G1D3_DALPE|nr:hypothetical protein DPEC_G00227780 [Dallia pectoralis]
MDTKDRPQRSLTRGRCRKDFPTVVVSSEPTECRVATQTSYSSSETLKAYDTHLRYGGCVPELVHHEQEEYVRQGSFTMAELGVNDQPGRANYRPSRSELGLLQRGYSLSAGSDADSDPEGVMSPERVVQLWTGQDVRSHRSSGLSSRENSALTLTDSDTEHKSDDESVAIMAQLAR